MVKGTLKVASSLVMVVMSKVLSSASDATIWSGLTLSTSGSAMAISLITRMLKP